MKKTLTMVLAFALVFALGVGGTLAWLTAETTEVKNTFTVGDVIIDLDEFDYDEDDNSEDNNYEYSSQIRDKANEYHLIPGKTYVKDPMVHVKAGSEACFLFVEVVNNLGEAEAEVEVADGGYGYETISLQMIENNWVPLEEGSNIWYLADRDRNILSVDASKSVDDLHYPVFKEFKVLETAVRGVSSNSDSDSSVYLGDYAGEIITIKAYAIQSEGLTGLAPDKIWAKF